MTVRLRVPLLVFGQQWFAPIAILAHPLTAVSPHARTRHVAWPQLMLHQGGDLPPPPTDLPRPGPRLPAADWLPTDDLVLQLCLLVRERAIHLLLQWLDASPGQPKGGLSLLLGCSTALQCGPKHHQVEPAVL